MDGGDGWAKTFKLLSGLFPEAVVTQEMWDMWREQLSPMNQEDVRNAIKTHWTEKQLRTPKLPAVKSILRQVRENRSASFGSGPDDRAAEEYEQQQVRMSQEATLDRLMNTPVDELRAAADLTRSRYGVILSKTIGNDPTDWSVMFRAAVSFVMDDQGDERDSELPPPPPFQVLHPE